MRIRVKRLEYSGKQVTVHVTESTPLRMDKLLKLVKEDKGMAKILPDGKIMLRIDSDSRENVATPQARRNLSSEHGERVPACGCGRLRRVPRGGGDASPIN